MWLSGFEGPHCAIPRGDGPVAAEALIVMVSSGESAIPRSWRLKERRWWDRVTAVRGSASSKGYAILDDPPTLFGQAMRAIRPSYPRVISCKRAKNFTSQQQSRVVILPPPLPAC